MREKDGAADRWDQVVSRREERRARGAGVAGPNAGPPALLGHCGRNGARRRRSGPVLELERATARLAGPTGRIGGEKENHFPFFF